MRIVLIVAQSLDGRITRHDAPGASWASAADQTWFRQSLREFDAHVMARKTYETIRAQLQPPPTSGPRRIVMTHHPENFANDTSPGTLEFTDDTAHQIRHQLIEAGCQACALLGGASAHDVFLAADLVDEIWVTIEPRLFGTGTPIVRETQDRTLKLIHCARLEASDSILARYEVVR